MRDGGFGGVVKMLHPRTHRQMEMPDFLALTGRTNWLFFFKSRGKDLGGG